MKTILVLNPGSTSTKIAIYNEEKQIAQFSIRHSIEELQQFESIIDQFDFRYNLILEKLKSESFPLDFSIVMGRGGMLPPIESGVYEVNDVMLSTLFRARRGEHASNLGAFLADKIARQIKNCRAFIADPVSVDEMEEVARISGLPEIPRQSIFHALNHKAAGRYHASKVGKKYEELNLVIAHLGGGITVGAHKKGRVVDVNQGLDGYGPIAPERSGTLDMGQLIRLCYEGKFSKSEIFQKLAGKGGLTAHLGSNDVQNLCEKALKGDKKVELLLNAMSYTIGKEIGGMVAALQGEVDGIILTGGVAFNTPVTAYITKMVEKFAPVFIYPGEDEMGALASNAVRILNGEKPKEFKL
jgi:butyrate kinase